MITSGWIIAGISLITITATATAAFYAVKYGQKAMKEILDGLSEDFKAFYARYYDDRKKDEHRFTNLESMAEKHEKDIGDIKKKLDNTND